MNNLNFNVIDNYVDTNIKVDTKHIHPLILNQIKQDYYKQKHKQLEVKLNTFKITT